VAIHVLAKILVIEGWIGCEVAFQATIHGVLIFQTAYNLNPIQHILSSYQRRQGTKLGLGGSSTRRAQVLEYEIHIVACEDIRHPRRVVEL
jgi:hypothetical protein